MGSTSDTLLPFAASSPSLHDHRFPPHLPQWRSGSLCFLPRRSPSPPRGLPLCLSNLSVTADAPLGFSPKASRRVRRGIGSWHELEMGMEDDDGGSSATDLEDELYDFMVNSANPGRFPSKRDLIAAGRMDLVQAVANRGGWLSLGWDLDASGVYASVEKKQQQWGDDHGSRAASSSDASSSGRSIEMGERYEDIGIDGILSRLEKERSFSFGLTPVEKGLNGGHNKACQGDDSWYLAGTGEKYGRCMLLDPGEDLLYNHGVIEEIPTGSKKLIDHNFSKSIQLRLQHLESKLKSTLSILRSKSAFVLPEFQGSSSKQLNGLSDDWEFLETEIMKAQDKLRSLRAKLSVIEGKMSLDIGEAQVMLVEKQKRIDTAQKALQILRTVCIVWPNTASEVFFSGSFDGWSSQRRMERSSTGVFSLCLRLYPGQYEIKFIVDGVWRIDPLRPIVNNNGHENNLILVT